MFCKETLALYINTRRLASAQLINKCFNCNKLEHFTSNCLKLKKSDLHEIEEEAPDS